MAGNESWQFEMYLVFLGNWGNSKLQIETTDPKVLPPPCGPESQTHAQQLELGAEYTHLDSPRRPDTGRTAGCLMRGWREWVLNRWGERKEKWDCRKGLKEIGTERKEVKAAT